MQDFYQPKEGDVAPNFRLPSTRGKEVTLKEFRGKDVILYFYPKDDTPGCTAEACSFRDHESELTKEHAVVLGVSTDSLESHEKFHGKHNLNFPLLSDQTADVAKMYGVWKEKNLYGRRTWGVARTTYWIGADGRIRKIYKKVDTARHAEDILEDLRASRRKK
ncbi:MAG TPA: thioredoxin-dependent thiol peroxidase [Thermoanaerobaculia bacterium]|nr:thioredoxin-dependent thiol peroxidase [Thermoanaerobaculia bacterium]